MSVWYQSSVFITPGAGDTVIPMTKGKFPKFLHTWTAINTSDQVIQAGAASNHGFSAGVTLGDFATLQHREANATVNTQRASTAGFCVHIRNPVNDVILAQGSAVMNEDDITITWDTFTAGLIVHYEILGGDMDVAVQMVVANSSPHVGVGFAPEMVLMSTAGNLFPVAPGSTTSIHSYQSYGVAFDKASGIDQWCLFTYMGDNDLDSLGSGLSGLNGDVAGQYDVDFASWQIQLSSFDADGITWLGSNADEVMMAFLSFRGAIRVQVDVIQKATGAAPFDQDFVFDFEPQGVYLATACEVSTAINVNRDSRHCHGALDGFTPGHSFLTTADNGTGADSHSRSDEAMILQISQNLNGLGVEASAVGSLHYGPGSPFLRLRWDPNNALAAQIGVIMYEGEGRHNRPAVVSQAVNRAGAF